MSFPHFCVYLRFKYTPHVNSTMVYEKVLFTSFWHREVSGKVFLRALYSKFSHFPIQCIANMSFPHLCMYFRFKYNPLVNSTMVYEKGSIYVFLASRSFGESVSQSTLYQIFTFSHIMYCKHVIFTFLSVFPFQIYTPS